MFKYEGQHAYGIVGVAWYVDESILLKHPDVFPTAGELLKPKNNPPGYRSNNYGEEAISRKIAYCVVKIKRRIDGNYVCSWESLETAHHVGESTEVMIPFTWQPKFKSAASTPGGGNPNLSNSN